MPEAHFAKGEYLYRSFLHYEKALVELNRAEQGGLRDTHFLRVRASVYRRQGRWHESIADFEAAAALSPRDATAMWGLGGVYQMVKRFADARRYFERSEALAPDSLFLKVPIPHMEHRALGNPHAFDAFFLENFLQADLFTFNRYALFLVLEGKHQELLTLLRQSAAEKPSFLTGAAAKARFLYFSGMAHQGLDDHAAARENFELALQEIAKHLATSPEDYDSIRLKGDIILELGDTRQAVAIHRQLRAVKSQQDDAFGNLDYELSLIVALSANGDIDEAMQRLDVYLALNAVPSLGYVLKHPHMKAIQTHDDFPALVAKYGLVWKDQSPGAKP